MHGSVHSWQSVAPRRWAVRSQEVFRRTGHRLQEMRKQSGEVLFQRREPIEGVEQKRWYQVARLDLWVQKRGEVVKQSLVLGVKKALIVVVGRDER